MSSTINIDNDVIVPTEYNQEISIKRTSNDYAKYVVRLEFNVDSTEYQAGGYGRGISRTLQSGSTGVNEAIATGIYKYYIGDATYDASTCEYVADSNNVFTKNNENGYFFDGQGHMIVSPSKNVWISVFAYDATGNLIAVGHQSYSGKSAN